MIDVDGALDRAVDLGFVARFQAGRESAGDAVKLSSNGSIVEATVKQPSRFAREKSVTFKLRLELRAVCCE